MYIILMSTRQEEVLEAEEVDSAVLPQQHAHAAAAAAAAPGDETFGRGAVGNASMTLAWEQMLSDDSVDSDAFLGALRHSTLVTGPTQSIEAFKARWSQGSPRGKCSSFAGGHGGGLGGRVNPVLARAERAITLLDEIIQRSEEQQRCALVAPRNASPQQQRHISHTKRQTERDDMVHTADEDMPSMSVNATWEEGGAHESQKLEEALIIFKSAPESQHLGGDKRRRELEMEGRERDREEEEGREEGRKQARERSKPIQSSPHCIERREAHTEQSYREKAYREKPIQSSPHGLERTPQVKERSPQSSTCSPAKANTWTWRACFSGSSGEEAKRAGVLEALVAALLPPPVTPLPPPLTPLHSKPPSGSVSRSECFGQVAHVAEVWRQGGEHAHVPEAGALVDASRAHNLTAPLVSFTGISVDISNQGY